MPAKTRSGTTATSVARRNSAPRPRMLSPVSPSRQLIVGSAISATPMPFLLRSRTLAFSSTAAPRHRHARVIVEPRDIGDRSPGRRETRRHGEPVGHPKADLGLAIEDAIRPVDAAEATDELVCELPVPLARRVGWDRRAEDIGEIDVRLCWRLCMRRHGGPERQTGTRHECSYRTLLSVPRHDRRPPTRPQLRSSYSHTGARVNALNN